MKQSRQGRSLELYFIDGQADGMQTAEELNWTGHVLLTPRTSIAKALKRSQAQHTGVYLLLGEGKAGEPLLYIGESENMRNRIQIHDTNKDWWTKAVLITTGADRLHKAHVRYLEARMVEIAKSARRVALANANQPSAVSLPEAAQNSMEVFLETLLMVLPAMRIDCFRELGRPGRDTSGSDELNAPVFELVVKKHGIAATAIVVDGEIVVRKGSRVRDKWCGANPAPKGYADLHESDVLRMDGSHAVFTRDYAFASPSAAGVAVTGNAINGTIAWKLQNSGKTYKEWEADQLGMIQPETSE